MAFRSKRSRKRAQNHVGNLKLPVFINMFSLRKVTSSEDLHSWEKEFFISDENCEKTLFYIDYFSIYDSKWKRKKNIELKPAIKSKLLMWPVWHCRVGWNQRLMTIVSLKCNRVND